jgi:DNA-directed RNA polymerase subunit RPC12/RpoP
MPNEPSRETPTAECAMCGGKLVAKPVPGAKKFPRRLECSEHGWQQEKTRAIRMRFHKDRPNW